MKTINKTITDYLDMMSIHVLRAVAVQFVHNALLRIKRFDNLRGTHRRLTCVDNDLKVRVTDDI